MKRTIMLAALAARLVVHDAAYVMAPYTNMIEVVWVALLVIAAALSAWTGFQYLTAKKGAA